MSHATYRTSRHLPHMVHPFRLYTLLAIVLAVSLVLPSTAVGEDDPASAHDLNDEEQDFLRAYWDQFDTELDDELQTDAVALAADRFDTSVARALYQLILQRHITDLRGRLFHEFEGVYTDISIDHHDNANIAIHITQQKEGLRDEVRQWLNAHSLSHHKGQIGYEQARLPLAQLYRVQEGVHARLEEEQEDASLGTTSVARVAGHVYVRFYEYSEREEKIARDLQERYGDAVNISDELAEPAEAANCTVSDCEDEGLMRAGLQVSSSAAPNDHYCSSGIMMHGGIDSDEKYALSAAHCFGEGESIFHPDAGDSFVGGIPGGGWSSDADAVRIYMGTNANDSDFDHTRWIYEDASRQRYGVGDYSRVFEISEDDVVYQSGATSVLEMGEIIETDAYAGSYCNRFCVEPDRGFWTNADLGRGDSGGATYVRDGEADAYGLISAGRYCDDEGNCSHSFSTYISDIRAELNLHVTGAE